MKNTIGLLVLLCSAKVWALNIYSANIAAISDSAINVSVTTQAEELYYYHSWHYVIADHAIVLEICFVSGFGSTINLLNNNFEIPLNTAIANFYEVNIKVFYRDLEWETQQLQDELSGRFTTPLNGPVEITPNHVSFAPTRFFPNPTKDQLFIGENQKDIAVYDQWGRKVMELRQTRNMISLSALCEGLYFLKIVEKGKKQSCAIIVKK